MSQEGGGRQPKERVPGRTTSLRQQAFDPLAQVAFGGGSGAEELRGVLGVPVCAAKSGNMLSAGFAARGEGLARVAGWSGCDGRFRSREAAILTPA